MVACLGTTDNHCCWLGGPGQCQYLQKNFETKEIACGLMVELGTWENVYADSRYINNVKPHLENYRPGLDCGEYPWPGKRCDACGVENNG